MESQFDNNLSLMFSDLSLYHSALLRYHSDLSDLDLDSGLYDRYVVPQWLGQDMAEEIGEKVEQWILGEWTSNADQYKELYLQTD